MRLSVAADWPCLFHPGLIAFHRKRQTNDKHSDLIVNWRRREAGKKRVKEDLRNYCRVGGRRRGRRKGRGRGEGEAGAWKKRVKRKTEEGAETIVPYFLLSDLHGRVHSCSQAIVGILIHTIRIDHVQSSNNRALPSQTCDVTSRYI